VSGDPGGSGLVRTLGRTLFSPAAAALALYGIGAILVTHDVWASPTTSWIGLCCDPEQAIWYLRWVPYAIGHATNPFITHQLNAPDGVNLMWNTPVFVAGLLAAPVTLLAGPIAAYNALMVAAIALSGWCAYLALRRYAPGVLAPTVGGAVYGFSPYVVPHALLHLDLAIAIAPPLFLLVLDELLVRRRRPPRMLGVALGLISVFQVLTEEEVLLMAVILAGLLAAVLAVHRRDQVGALAPRVGQALLWATTTFVLLAAVPLAVQFLGPLRIQGPLQNTDTFSTDLLNLVVPTRFQMLAPQAATRISDTFSGLTPEATAYIGLPLLLLLIAFTARHWEDLRIRAASIVGGAAFVLSLGPQLNVGGRSTGWPLPWWPVTHVPLIQDVLPNRTALFGWLAIAVLLTLAIDSAGRGAEWRRGLPRLAVVAVSLVFVLPARLPASTTTVPVFFQHWRQEGIPSGTVVMVAPFFRDGAAADPMLWSAAAGIDFAMPEAYAVVPQADGSPLYGPSPTQLSEVMEAIQDHGTAIIARGAVRSQIARDIRAKDIREVIVGPMQHRGEMVRFFADLLGRPPESTDGVDVWRGVDRHGVTGGR
jgi:hypothetical protein